MRHKHLALFISLFLPFGFLFFQNISNTEQYISHIDENYNVFSLPLPEKFLLFGESIPLYKPHVQESFDRELLVNTYWQSNAMLSIKRANKWFPLIEEILKEQGVPNDFKYLAVIESGLQNLKSPAGARGVWQFMESSGESFDLEINDNVDERYHLEKATLAACNYLKSARKSLGGSWTLAAASYNMGVAGIKKRLNEQQVGTYFDLYLNSETARYIYRIAAVKHIFEHQSSFGINIRKQDLYSLPSTQIVKVDTAINDLVSFAKEFSISYRDLKEFNPWMRNKYLENKSGKIYEIKIPIQE